MKAESEGIRFVFEIKSQNIWIMLKKKKKNFARHVLCQLVPSCGE
jgi:hypothetical protein